MTATLVLAAGFAPAGGARADFGIRPDPGDPALPDFRAGAYDSAGSAETQAGSHPYELSTEFFFNTRDDGNGSQAPDGNVKDITVDLPQGVIGNPQAVPTCAESEFNRPGATLPPPFGANRATFCPVDSQVGVAYLRLYNASEFEWQTPVYNVEPHDDEVAAFAFNVLVVGVRLRASIDPRGGYHVRVVLGQYERGERSQCREIVAVGRSR
jgi:hypothetical protein